MLELCCQVNTFFECIICNNRACMDHAMSASRALNQWHYFPDRAGRETVLEGTDVCHPCYRKHFNGKVKANA